MEKRNPNSQPAQGPLLSLRRRPGGRDEAGRRGQGTDRARIFALPTEPSPSHAASSSSCSQTPIKLPPVHLGQPKVGPRKLKALKVPQVELGQAQAAPQGSRSQALSPRGDRLPPLSPVPRLAPLPALPCPVSPRDTPSRGTELGSAGEKEPQPPRPWQPYTPMPRVFLPPLRVAQEGTARVSPSWQLSPVPPMSSGAQAMEHSLMDMALEKKDSQRENDKELSQGENSNDRELSPVTERSKLFPGDSLSDVELSPVEEAIEVSPRHSLSDQELSQVEEAIMFFPGENSSDEELSPAEDDNELSKGDNESHKELSQGEEMHEEDVSQGESDSDKELSQGDNNEDEQLSPEDGKHETELSFGEDCNIQAMSPREEDYNRQLSQWEDNEDKELSHWAEDEDEELSLWDKYDNKELIRRILLGGMERDQSSSPELPDLEEVPGHQKVLEWLEANFPDDDGRQEEDETKQRLARLQWWKEKVEARKQDELDSISSLGFNVGGQVLSKGKHCSIEELSQGEDASQDKIWNQLLGLTEDENPLEGPHRAQC